jgi:hypothetical protein
VADVYASTYGKSLASEITNVNNHKNDEKWLEESKERFTRMFRPNFPGKELFSRLKTDTAVIGCKNVLGKAYDELIGAAH